jgi:transposase-like protein
MPLIVSDACLGLVEAAGEVFPQAARQRCGVHWYRNAFAHARVRSSWLRHRVISPDWR